MKIPAWNVNSVRARHVRALALPEGNGLRIDHVFATEPLAARSTGAEVDRDGREGESPSDHAPVIAAFGP